MRKLNFKKENKKWYIVLKSWPGPKSALQMVLGADTLLDKISQNGHTASIGVKSQKDSGSDWVCVKDTSEDCTYGRWYNVYKGGKKMHRMWLCPVTRFVFKGFYPEKIVFEKLAA